MYQPIFAMARWNHPYGFADLHPKPMLYYFLSKNVKNWPKWVKKFTKIGPNMSKIAQNWSENKKASNQSIISASSDNFLQLGSQDAQLFARLWAWDVVLLWVWDMILIKVRDVVYMWFWDVVFICMSSECGSYMSFGYCSYMGLGCGSHTRTKSDVVVRFSD